MPLLTLHYLKYWRLAKISCNVQQICQKFLMNSKYIFHIYMRHSRAIRPMIHVDGVEWFSLHHGISISCSHHKCQLLNPIGMMDRIFKKGGKSLAMELQITFITSVKWIYIEKDQLNCWPLRCSRSQSIACRRCSKYIFILDLTPGSNELGKGKCKTRRGWFKFWDLVHLILVICWLDWICLTTTHVLQDILAVLHK